MFDCRMVKKNMQTNYQLLLDNELKKIQEQGVKQTLLLHVCCAPCSSYVLEYLHKYFKITVYYYNPNISPEDEYFKRAQEVKRLCRDMKLDDVSVIVENYDPASFYDLASGLENEPERGKRCVKCYRLRLEASAIYAKAHSFDYFTTTLTISPLKNAQMLNEIGAEMSQKYSVNYLFSDFKKREGYKRSIELSRIYNLYRQDFCGCEFSKNKNN